jgi:hypothetical protein
LGDLVTDSRCLHEILEAAEFIRNVLAATRHRMNKADAILPAGDGLIFRHSGERNNILAVSRLTGLVDQAFGQRGSAKVRTEWRTQGDAEYRPKERQKSALNPPEHSN